MRFIVRARVKSNDLHLPGFRRIGEKMQGAETKKSSNRSSRSSRSKCFRIAEVKYRGCAEHTHPNPSCPSGFSKNTRLDVFRSDAAESIDCVIPALSAGIQVDTDVSGRILAKLDAGYPCRHDDLHFHLLWTSVKS
jgi:hypothetical protein